MNQTTRVSDVNPPTVNRARAPLVGAVLLGGALVVAACGASATPSPTSPTPPASGSPAASASASPGIAGALQADYIRVVNTVRPSIVVIETATGLGSGIVFDTKGDIVTNNHVVAGSTTFSVTIDDGRKLTGKLVGTYPAGDLAVIRVPAAGLQPATFGDSSSLVVGDIVLAVGNPLGLDTTVTEGIVSALNRTVSESTTVTLPNVIQTSALINPGNSGGALVDLAGHVIGMPTLTALDPDLGDSAAAGIGFAIPGNDAADVATQLIDTGKVTSTPAPSASPAVSPTASGSTAP